MASALREQKAAQKEANEANARVVEATSKLPPHYVDEHRRFGPGERERIQGLIDRAQRASDRLGIATSEVVNLRSHADYQASATPGKRDSKLVPPFKIWGPKRGDARSLIYDDIPSLAQLKKEVTGVMHARQYRELVVEDAEGERAEVVGSAGAQTWGKWH